MAEAESGKDEIFQSAARRRILTQKYFPVCDKNLTTEAEMEK